MRDKATTESRLARRRHRHCWRTLHAVLGISAGLVFTIIGLTGSLLAFWPELDVWMHPALIQVSAHADQEKALRSLDDIVAAARSVIPADGQPYALVYPRFPDSGFVVTYSRPAPDPKQLEWHQVFIDPYTALVTGKRLQFDMERPWRGSLFDFILRLHYTLALGAQGATLVGIIALALMVLLASGIVLWWPASTHISSAFTIKRGGSHQRFLYDLHKTVGFYASVLLMIALFSGLYLVFPDYVKALIGIFSTTGTTPHLTSAPSHEQRPIGFDEVAAIADETFPDGRFQWIFFPQGANGVYKIVKKAPLERTDILPARALWIDQYSGQVLHTHDPAHYTTGQTFMHWLFPLHSGEAFGWPGRFMILCLGLVPGALFITGLIRWRQNRRGRERGRRHEEKALFAVSKFT
ncbi:MAG: PepSY domain-containing protein [Nitrospirales bacterium]|nr:PepSY domain-containing protein [Nitrospirales bacterium]